MKKLTQLYYISNHEWLLSLKPVSYAYLALFFLNLIIGAAGNAGFADFDPELPLMPMRFEQFISSSGFAFIHILILVYVCSFIAYSWHRHFAPVRSLDRLYHLPLGISRIFLVRLALGTLLLMAVQVVQVISLVSVYYASYLPATADVGIRQGLYLAFRRSWYLRLLLPADPAAVILTLLLTLLVVVALYTLVNLTRIITSKKVLPAAGIILAGMAAFAVSTAYDSLADRRSVPLQLARQLPLVLLIIILIMMNLRWLRRRLLS